MATGSIEQEQSGAVRRLIITNPSRKNAINDAMYTALARALEAADADPSVSVVVLAGAGGNVFTSGNDVGSFNTAARDADETPPSFDFLRTISGFSKPLIAEVGGLAVGVGATMLLHCDFVLAARSAWFQFPFVDLGLVPEAASTLLLPRQVGRIDANRLLLLGEKMTADEALATRLITAVHSDAELPAAVIALAGKIAAKPLWSLVETKALLRGPRTEILERMDAEGIKFAEGLAGPAFAAAAAAFLARSSG